MTSNSIRVYAVDGDFLISQMFMNREGYELVHELPNADIVVFPGGADVSPRLYGEERHPTTFVSPETDRRHEQYFNRAFDQGKRLVGICRGGQFLNVMSGGRMFQNVDRHAIAGTHTVTYLDPRDTFGGSEHQVTSTHHQMMRPSDDGELWGISDRSQFKETADKVYTPHNPEFGPDVEIVFYPETQSLCFQPHPEYDSEECRDLFFTCLSRMMEN